MNKLWHPSGIIGLACRLLKMDQLVSLVQNRVRKEPEFRIILTGMYPSKIRVHIVR